MSEYRYEWYFGDGATTIKDTQLGTDMEDIVKEISDCYACVCITASGREFKVTHEGKDTFRKFLRELTAKILDELDKVFSVSEKENLKEEAYRKLSGKNSDVLSRNFFQKIMPDFLEQALGAGTFDRKGSYFKFNTKNSSVNPEDNQTNNGDDEKDIRKIISAAIEGSAKKCVIFTGAPGTGKTYGVEKYVEDKMPNFEKNEYFVQFHSSYDYTDFVEGLRPIKENGKREMTFVRMDGIFKAFCRKVVELNDENDYYFVIDEINRADLGRVFGELMYCFEKRGEKIATQYENLPAYGKDGTPISHDCFQEAGGFYIPENVVIIGTMNDIDRSVETFDFALRRRFDWVEIEADVVMERSLAAMGVPTDRVGQIAKMNAVIAKQSGLGEEFKIGPAYFKGYDGKNLNGIWKYNIQPILREYMRGRPKAKAFIDACETALLSGEGSETSAPRNNGGNANAPQGER